MVLKHAAARDKFALRGLNLWVSEIPPKLSNLSDFSSKISNISLNNLRVCWMLQDSKYALLIKNRLIKSRETLNEMLLNNIGLSAQ